MLSASQPKRQQGRRHDQPKHRLMKRFVGHQHGRNGTAQHEQNRSGYTVNSACYRARDTSQVRKRLGSKGLQKLILFHSYLLTGFASMMR